MGGSCSESPECRYARSRRVVRRELLRTTFFEYKIGASEEYWPVDERPGMGLEVSSDLWLEDGRRVGQNPGHALHQLQNRHLVVGSK